MIKQNELSSQEKTWRKFKHILLSKSQSENVASCMIHKILKNENYGDSKKISGCQGLGGRRV